jgi:hypothetical protein
LDTAFGTARVDGAGLHTVITSTQSDHASVQTLTNQLYEGKRAQIVRATNPTLSETELQQLTSMAHAKCGAHKKDLCENRAIVGEARWLRAQLKQSGVAIPDDSNVPSQSGSDHELVDEGRKKQKTMQAKNTTF